MTIGKFGPAIPLQQAYQPKRLLLLERGFKGGLYSGTVSIYVITLGFTLCLVLAVKAGQNSVPSFLPLGFGGLFWAGAVC